MLTFLINQKGLNELPEILPLLFVLFVAARMAEISPQAQSGSFWNLSLSGPTKRPDESRLPRFLENFSSQTRASCHACIDAGYESQSSGALRHCLCHFHHGFHTVSPGHAVKVAKPVLAVCAKELVLWLETRLVVEDAQGDRDKLAPRGRRLILDRGATGAAL